MKPKNHIFILLILTTLLLSDCGKSPRDTEVYNGGNPMIALDSARVHRGGYGRSECLVCHNAALNLHRNSAVPIDVNALNQAIKDNGQAAYCMTCHGKNGT